MVEQKVEGVASTAASMGQYSCAPHVLMKVGKVVGPRVSYVGWLFRCNNTCALPGALQSGF
jgi:hypothetical protein